MHGGEGERESGSYMGKGADKEVFIGLCLKKIWYSVYNKNSSSLVQSHQPGAHCILKFVCKEFFLVGFKDALSCTCRSMH